MADKSKPQQTEDGVKPQKLRAEKNYHSIDEFLDLSFEELFQEPVYVVDDAEEAEVLDYGDEGLVVSEERFLELEFEALFDQPVRLGRRLKQEDDTEAAFTTVQSQASTLEIKRVLFGNQGTEETDVRVISIEQDFAIQIDDPAPTGNSQLLPVLVPNVVPTGVTSGDSFGGALQEDTALGVQTINGNLFEPSDNLFGIVPSGTGGVSIKIFTRPGSGQTIEDDDGDIITVTTPYGNTFEYNQVTNDYTYTLNGPVMHKNLAPTDDGNDDNDLINLPITDGNDPDLYDLPLDFTPSFQVIPRPNIDPDNDGIPTVKEIVDAIFSDVGGFVVYAQGGFIVTGGVFPGFSGGLSYNDLPFNPDAHNFLPGGPGFPIDKIDAAFIDEFNASGDDFDIGRAFYDVIVIDVTNSLGQIARGFAIFKIIDDIPVLSPDINEIDETAFFVNNEMAQTTGNLLINDDKGLDDGVIISIDGVVDDDSDGFITVMRTGSNNIESMIMVDVVTGAYTYDLIDATNATVTRTFDIDGDLVADLIGDDIYTYVFEDNDGDQATSTLTVAVNLNEGPTANPDPNYATNEADLTVDAATGLLANDTDPDMGDTKAVVSVNGDPLNVGSPFTFTITDLLVDGAPSGFEVNPIVTVSQDGSFVFDVDNAGSPLILSFQSGSGNVDYQEVNASSNNQFDFMSQGETALISINYLMGDAEFVSPNGDGTTSSSSSFTVTITGVNDAPIAKDLGITTNEDTGFTGVQLDANDFDTDDNPFSLTYAIKSVDMPAFASNFAIVGNKLDFTPGTDFDYLSQGQDLNIKITYTATDMHGAVSNDAVASLVIAGVNDEPEFLTADQNGAVIEIDDMAPGESTLLNMLNGSFDYQDVDLQDTHDLTVSSSTTATDNKIIGTFTPTLNQTDNVTGQGTLTWVYAVNDSQLEFLGDGEQIIETFTLTIDDTIASTTARNVTITLTGANDGPTIASADATGEVTELTDGDPQENVKVFMETGTIEFEDLDLSDGHTLDVSLPLPGYLGNFVASITNVSTGDGQGIVTWDFSVADSALDSLAAGEQLVQAYAINITDSASAFVTQNVTITLTGTNDDPIITVAEDTGSVTEVAAGGVGEDTVDHMATGVIDFEDVDLIDVHTVNITPQAIGYLGKFEAIVSTPSTGVGMGEVTWTFTVNDADLDALGAADMPTQVYEIEIDDGQGGTATQNVTITLNGANDPPTITSGTGTVTEDAPAPDNKASGDLMPVDDDGPLPYTITVDFGGTTDSIESDKGGVASVDGLYGTLEVNKSGLWEYTIDNTKADPLDGGDVATETFDITISDGTLSSMGTIKVNVNGTNDLPTSADNNIDINNKATEYVLTIADFAFNDVDEDDTQLASIKITDLPDVGTLVLDGIDVIADQVVSFANINAGKLVFQLADGDPMVGNKYDTFDFSVNDGTADSTLDYTITFDVFENMAPTFTNGTGSVAEDALSPGNEADGNLMPMDDGPSTYSIEVSFMGGGTKTINSSDAGLIQVSGLYGLLDIAGDGSWLYVLDDTLDDALDEGDMEVESFDITISDGFLSSSGTINVTAAGINDLPSSADNTTEVEDDETSYAFSTSDFAFMDVDAGDTQFSSVKITSLPTILGALLVNGVAVNLNDDIDFATINSGLLTYNFLAPPTVGTDFDSFGYSINDGLADSALSYTQTIDVVAAAAPVVLDLNLDNQIHLISANDSDVTFEYNSQLVQMGWVGPEDGFLVYDVDGSGGFSGLHEIILADYHPDANTDLEGLKLAFDSNQDNLFDANDAAWLDFGVWQDKNTDGIADDGEFSSLANAGVISISLESDNQLQSDEGNTIYGYSEYTLASGEVGLVGDIGLEILAEEDVIEQSSLSDLIASTESTEFILSESEEVAPEPVANAFEENQVIEQMVQSSQDQTGI